MIINFKKKHYFYLYLIIFTVVNLLFLTKFPFVHSDESWLAGLSRSFLKEGSIYATEPFFNLYKRFPHTLKTLFHIIQIPFITLIGYKIFSVRLISMFFSLLSLIYFYKILDFKYKNTYIPLLGVVLLSLNIQYIYASHFARQEILLVFVMIFCFFLYLKSTKPSYIGLVIAISIGIHPNAFFIALIFGFIYLYDILTKKKTFKEGAILVSTVSFGAIIWIILSLIGDSNFFSHYANTGKSFNVHLSLLEKILTFDNFYYKLFNQLSATYYTPDIRIYFIAFIFIFLLSISFIVLKLTIKIKPDNYLIKLIISILAINLGILIVGRYNPTSIIFIFPFFYLAIIHLLSFISKKRLVLIIFAFIITISFMNSYKNIVTFLPYSYEDHIKKVDSAIEDDSITLGNLTSQFAFNYSKFLDIRNLRFLKENDMTFLEYVEKYNIEYIIYYEELDYIYNNPEWNILYGQMDYLEELKSFLDSKCSLQTSFSDSQYGIRIVRYMHDYDWKIYIYSVN